MKAAVCTGYGSPDVVQIAEVEKPVPKDNEVLVKVRAAAVNPLDSHLMKGKPSVMRLAFGLHKPRDPRVGRDVAGEVESVGRGVSRLKPGDEVFGVCLGAFAEYASASESKLAIKPGNVSFEQAASAPIAALTALQALRDTAHVQPGQKVLINGASGGVGTFAVQIAKSFGAEVTGVCSAKNLDMLRSIGADHLFDYTREDFTRSGQRYDMILDLVASHSLSACRRVLSSKGTYVAAGALGGEGMLDFLALAIKPPVVSWFVSQKMVGLLAKAGTDDLTMIGSLMESGRVTPVIDRSHSLSDVAAAIRHVAEKHALGKVVIVVP